MSTIPNSFHENAKTTGRRMPNRTNGTSATNASIVANRLRVYKSNSGSKWVAREIAALEFLLGIPLEAERDIVSKGWVQQQGVGDGHSKANRDEEEKVEVLEPPTQQVFLGNSQLQPTGHSHQGRWWEKFINNPKQNSTVSEHVSRHSRGDEEELEQPPDMKPQRETQVGNAYSKTQGLRNQQPLTVPVVHAPGRRLQGEEATKIQVPIMDDASLITRQKNIARMAVTREWEIKVAHGLGNNSDNKLSKKSLPVEKQVFPPMLDGRLFLSAGESYPMQVFSLKRYEPKKEEAARRRKKLEARGGGGTQFFVMPIRDWRGISYRALLPDIPKKAHGPNIDETLRQFDRFASSPSDMQEKSTDKESVGNTGRSEERSIKQIPDEEDDENSLDSEHEDTYLVGLLDDPEMVQGRHRNVMIGDRVSGPIVSSTIQFVKPKLLKADLNKQFRERFDGWEPPRSQRKFIGARVVDGIYTLIDPSVLADEGTIAGNDEDTNPTSISNATTGAPAVTPRKRQGSISSLSTGGEAKETIRMPPSLTLSKIRSIKQQALLAAVKAKLEISTVALSIVYFERLCLDCRVDKTNRRLSFAACLLLALKMNEAHVELVMTKAGEEDSRSARNGRIQSLIRPAQKSGKVFASLLEFFTQQWSLSLKHLFAAEWGVFAALQFRLHAKPSHVAFHFKRLLKALNRNPRLYLGLQMYSYWQDALAEEEYLRVHREARREKRRERKERKKLFQLQIELEATDRNDNEVNSTGEKSYCATKDDDMRGERGSELEVFEYSPISSPTQVVRHSLRPGIGSILTRFSGGKRTMSSGKLSIHEEKTGNDVEGIARLRPSPSMPTFSSKSPSEDIPDIEGNDSTSYGSIISPPDDAGSAIVI